MVPALSVSSGGMEWPAARCGNKGQREGLRLSHAHASLHLEAGMPKIRLSGVDVAHPSWSWSNNFLPPKKWGR